MQRFHQACAVFLFDSVANQTPDLNHSPFTRFNIEYKLPQKNENDCNELFIPTDLFLLI
jgi:hypothetical protein